MGLRDGDASRQEEILQLRRHPGVQIVPLRVSVRG